MLVRAAEIVLTTRNDPVFHIQLAETRGNSGFIVGDERPMRDVHGVVVRIAIEKEIARDGLAAKAAEYIERGKAPVPGNKPRVVQVDPKTRSGAGRSRRPQGTHGECS
jgi:hypothetical protein